MAYRGKAYICSKRCSYKSESLGRDCRCANKLMLYCCVFSFLVLQFSYLVCESENYSNCRMDEKQCSSSYKQIAAALLTNLQSLDLGKNTQRVKRNFYRTICDLQHVVPMTVSTVTHATLTYKRVNLLCGAPC